MQLDHLNVLAAFLTIAEERSFTKAAKRLGVSRSALSHSVRGLEERLGVRLLARTTRSVAPTEVGEQLIGRLRPALGEVESVLDQIVGLRERPTGRVRLLVTPLSATMVLAPKLVSFARRFPDIVLDVTTTQEGRTELVAAGFDAGIHLGESIQRDMVAVRVSRDHRLAVVGSPDYFAAHPKPSSPHDLPSHRCINLRGGSAGPYRWEFEKDGETLAVDVSGPLIVDDADLMIRAAVDGLGLTFPSRSTSRHRSRAARSCVCWTTGVRRSLAIFSTIRVGGSSRPRCQPSSRRFACRGLETTMPTAHARASRASFEGSMDSGSCGYIVLQLWSHMETVGIRDLKTHLSRHLKRVRSGVRLAVTERGRAIATISPVESPASVDWAHRLVAEGRARWNGGKPKGAARRRRSSGRTAASVVLEDRR
jgi:DNA-binding transcriptional LysR family regulator/antitoxin (DNA-binding transcriptional repressor) of toxin-antitoxin stability system